MSIKTRIGRTIRVVNQDGKRNAKKEYESVLLKKNGKIIPCLFTDVELEIAASRARKNIEDTLEQSIMSKLID